MVGYWIPRPILLRCCQEMAALPRFSIPVFSYQTKISAVVGLNLLEVVVFLFKSIVGKLYTPVHYLWKYNCE
jgi:hypothetical protein